MKISSFLGKQNLDGALLIGYYGGGNYGDELLLEVLANFLAKYQAKNVSIVYQNPNLFKTFHKDFNYKLIDQKNKFGFLKSIISHKMIMIGGGGHWGLDTNINHLFLGLVLFFAKLVARKKIVLLGVGYYNSSSFLGKISAFLTGKAAHKIIARDRETYDNFKKISTATYLDKDICWYISGLNLDQYAKDLTGLEEKIVVQQRTILISIRRFQKKYNNDFADLVLGIIAKNQDKKFIVLQMEPKEVDPEGHKFLLNLRKEFNNVQILDFSFNPIALFLFLKKYQHELVYIGPQYHGILSAFLNDIPTFPLVYDNKVGNLFDQLGQKTRFSIYDLEQKNLQDFIDSVYKITKTKIDFSIYNVNGVKN